MRFDETLDGLLGAGLEGLGAQAAFLPSNMTYDERRWRATGCQGHWSRACALRCDQRHIVRSGPPVEAASSDTASAAQPSSAMEPIP